MHLYPTVGNTSRIVQQDYVQFPIRNKQATYSLQNCRVKVSITKFFLIWSITSSKLAFVLIPRFGQVTNAYPYRLLELTFLKDFNCSFSGTACSLGRAKCIYQLTTSGNYEENNLSLSIRCGAFFVSFSFNSPHQSGHI